MPADFTQSTLEDQIAKEWYIRATNGSDTPGGGTTHATAYQTLTFALNDIEDSHGYSTSFAGVDRINICSEADVVHTGTNLSTDFGTTRSSSHEGLWLEGYDTVAGDGGIGRIVHTGGDTSADGFIHEPRLNFANLDIICNSTNGITLESLTTSHCCMYNCRIWHEGTGTTVSLEKGSMIGCTIYRTSGSAYDGSSSKCVKIGIAEGAYMYGCILYAENCERAVDATTLPSKQPTLAHNIIVCNRYGYYCALNTLATGEVVVNNTFFAPAAEPNYIGVYSTNINGVFMNNYVEGWNNTGCIGMKNTGRKKLVIHNSVYDCTTAFDMTALTFDEKGNQTLSQSGVCCAGEYNFVPVPSVIGKGYPARCNLDVGAIQYGSGVGFGAVNKHDLGRF